MICVPRVFAYLLNVCKFLVWSQCNNFRFCSEVPSALRLLACVRSRIHFYLPLFFKRFASSRRRCFFNRQWGANGAVGVVSEDSFNLSLWACFLPMCFFFYPMVAFIVSTVLASRSFLFLPRGRLYWKYCVGLLTHPLSICFSRAFFTCLAVPHFVYSLSHCFLSTVF